MKQNHFLRPLSALKKPFLFFSTVAFCLVQIAPLASQAHLVIPRPTICSPPDLIATSIVVDTNLKDIPMTRVKQGRHWVLRQLNHAKVSVALPPHSYADIQGYVSCEMKNQANGFSNPLFVDYLSEILSVVFLEKLDGPMPRAKTTGVRIQPILGPFLYTLNPVYEPNNPFLARTDSADGGQFLNDLIVSLRNQVQAQIHPVCQDENINGVPVHICGIRPGEGAPVVKNIIDAQIASYMVDPVRFFQTRILPMELYYLATDAFFLVQNANNNGGKVDQARVATLNQQAVMTLAAGASLPLVQSYAKRAQNSAIYEYQKNIEAENSCSGLDCIGTFLDNLLSHPDKLLEAAALFVAGDYVGSYLTFLSDLQYVQTAVGMAMVQGAINLAHGEPLGNVVVDITKAYATAEVGEFLSASMLTQLQGIVSPENIKLLQGPLRSAIISSLQNMHNGDTVTGVVEGMLKGLVTNLATQEILQQIGISSNNPACQGSAGQILHNGQGLTCASAIGAIFANELLSITTYQLIGLMTGTIQLPKAPQAPKAPPAPPPLPNACILTQVFSAVACPQYFSNGRLSFTTGAQAESLCMQQALNVASTCGAVIESFFTAGHLDLSSIYMSSYNPALPKVPELVPTPIANMAAPVVQKPTPGAAPSPSVFAPPAPVPTQNGTSATIANNGSGHKISNGPAAPVPPVKKVLAGGGGVPVAKPAVPAAKPAPPAPQPGAPKVAPGKIVNDLPPALNPRLHRVAN